MIRAASDLFPILAATATHAGSAGETYLLIWAYSLGVIALATVGACLMERYRVSLRAVIATALALLLLACATVARAGLLVEDVLVPYVEVRCGSGVGAGVVVNVAGDVLVLTAAHVVRQTHDTKSVELIIRQERGPDAMERRCVIVSYSPPVEDGGQDLALLRPKNSSGLRPARFDPKAAVEMGADCWYVGTPGGLHRSLEKSIISRTDLERKGEPFTVFNGAIWLGSSGGPLFVRDAGGYTLVGIVTHLECQRNPKSPGMARPVSAIVSLFDDYRKHKHASAVVTLGPLTVEIRKK